MFIYYIKKILNSNNCIKYPNIIHINFSTNINKFKMKKLKYRFYLVKQVNWLQNQEITFYLNYIHLGTIRKTI